jgi:hypothetical protein
VALVDKVRVDDRVVKVKLAAKVKVGRVKVVVRERAVLVRVGQDKAGLGKVARVA